MKHFEFRGTISAKYGAHELSIDVLVWYFPPGIRAERGQHEWDVEIYEVREVCHGRTRKLSKESMNELSQDDDFIGMILTSAVKEINNRAYNNAEDQAEARREERLLREHGNN